MSRRLDLRLWDRSDISKPFWIYSLASFLAFFFFLRSLFKYSSTRSGVARVSVKSWFRWLLPSFTPVIPSISSYRWKTALSSASFSRIYADFRFLFLCLTGTKFCSEFSTGFSRSSTYKFSSGFTGSSGFGLFAASSSALYFSSSSYSSRNLSSFSRLFACFYEK